MNLTRDSLVGLHRGNLYTCYTHLCDKPPDLYVNATQLLDIINLSSPLSYINTIGLTDLGNDNFLLLWLV